MKKITRSVNFVNIFNQFISFIPGAGEAAADVPIEGNGISEQLGDVTLNGDEAEEKGEEGAKKKRKRKPNKNKTVTSSEGGNVSSDKLVQTSPPSIPVSQLYPDGKN